MRAKLIVFSIIYVAPSIFKVPYGVGIVEGEQGKRMLVRIKEEYLNALDTGLGGEVREEPLEGRQLNFFYPAK